MTYWQWYIAAVILVVADMVLTMIGLSEGHAEGNPFLAWGIEAYGPDFMVAIKTWALWFLGVVGLLINTPREIKLFYYGCMLIAVVHLIPVFSWSYILIN